MSLIAEGRQKVINKAAETHLHKFVEQLINEEKLERQWLEIILKFAIRACHSLKPDVKLGDQLDIREYAKIKIIPHGSIDDCLYVDGVVFSKNIGHKNLKFDIENPKIL